MALAIVFFSLPSGLLFEVFRGSYIEELLNAYRFQFNVVLLYVHILMGIHFAKQS